MKRIICALAITAAGLALFNSCKKDKAEELSHDPRILKFKLNEFPYNDFIINDYKSEIYNYDSLPFGTDTRMHVYLSGYSAITMKYDSAGVWKDYMYTDTSIKLNLDSARIKTIAEDGKNFKEYTIKLRVHKYDVNAFTWTKCKNIEFESKVLYQSAIQKDDKTILFICDEKGENYKIFSTDLENWNTEKITSEKSFINWNNICVNKDEIYVLSEEGNLITGNIEKGNFTESSLKLKEILFTIDNKVFCISQENELIKINEDKSTEILAEIPNNFPDENIKKCTGKSGSTILGYVYGFKDEKAYFYAIDKNGNIILLANGKKLPHRKGCSLINFSNTVNICGGTDEKGDFSSMYFSSENGGITWANDWHKKIPEELKNVLNINVLNFSKDEIILIGGTNEGNYSTKVLKGRINQSILDEIKK